MGKIKGTNTKPEQTLRMALWASGLRYRINIRSLPGNPDIVMRKYKVVIFVDGEFWHGYNWVEKKRKLKTNRGFWIPKIERNMQRDKENNEKLASMGFTVLRFWGNDVKNNLSICVEKIWCSVQQLLPYDRKKT